MNWLTAEFSVQEWEETSEQESFHSVIGVQTIVCALHRLDSKTLARLLRMPRVLANETATTEVSRLSFSVLSCALLYFNKQERKKVAL